ncbi:Ig-like domain-containing protein [Candidatus Bipolaricaulota bacterium]|nr:Ig-like domain-containing protein [Candidatus Bipolaricaulota bacterium]
MSLLRGQTGQVTVTAHLSSGLTWDVTAQSSYQSDNASVAAVSPGGLVTAVSPGSATVTVSYQGLTAAVQVTVAEGCVASETGDIIVLKVPQLLVPVAYDCAAGFTVTENGIDVPVIRVEVKDGTGGWPYSEVWLYLEHPVTVGSEVIVEYWPDPDHPITPVSGGQAAVPQQTAAVNRSTVPFSIARGTIYVPASGDVVCIDLPTAVAVVDYDGPAGFTIHTGTATIPVSRVVAEGTRVRLYPVYRIPAGEPVAVSYVPVVGREITTVSGAPLVEATQPVAAANGSEAPLAFYDPVVLPDGCRVRLAVPADLGSGYYQGSMGFRVFSEGREIPVIAVELDGNKIILYLGAPLIVGSGVSVVYEPGGVAPIAGGGGTPLAGGEAPAENQSEVTVVSLTVEPSSLTLDEGSSARLTATAHYSDGSSADVTSLAEFLPADAGVARVERGLVTGLAPGATEVTVTYGGQTATVPVTVSAALEAIAVEPASVSIPAGRTQQLTVTARYSDGSTVDVTGEAFYQSDNEAVASISGAGLVTGLSQGTAAITVSYGGKTAVVPVSVGAPVVESVSVQPASVNLVAGKTQQLIVTAHYSDGSSRDVTDQASYLSGNTSVAAVSSSGLVTGESQGTTDISVSFEGRTAAVRVTVSAPVAESISVEPASVSIPAGRTQQLRVVAHYSDGSARDVTDQASYQSENSSVAAVSGTGLVKGISEGSTNVVVAYEGKTAAVPVVVGAAELESIDVEPASVSLPAGRTQQLSVTAHYSDGSTRDVTGQASYRSDNASVAAVSSSGLVTGLSQGTASVTVSFGGRSVSVPVAVGTPVAESLSVKPAEVSLPAGRTQQLSVTAHYSDGSARDVTNLASYQAGSASVATVSSAGLVKGVSQGTTTLTVSFEGRSASVPVTVTAPVLERISVSPDQLNVAAGKTGQLAVRAFYSDGSAEDVTARASYRSEDPSVAEVSGTGLVTGRAQGSTKVLVSFGGMTAVARVLVSEAVLESLSVEPASVNIPAGRTQQLTVTACYSDGTVKDVTGASSYQTSSRSVAAVSSSGEVTGVSKGSAEVTVMFGGRTASVPVTVTAPAAESLEVQPSPLRIHKSNSVRLKVLERYSDGSVLDVTGYAGFASSDPSVVRVSPTGVATGVKEGNATVRVTYKGKTCDVPAEVLPIVVIPPPGK